MLARSGGDPLADRRHVLGVLTFAEAAQRVLEQEHDHWRGGWHAQNWIRSMERYAFPRIGRRPVSEVNTTDVLETRTPIWHVKAATAREVRQRIRSMLESGRSPWTCATTTHATGCAAGPRRGTTS